MKRQGLFSFCRIRFEKKSGAGRKPIERVTITNQVTYNEAIFSPATSLLPTDPASGSEYVEESVEKIHRTICASLKNIFCFSNILPRFLLHLRTCFHFSERGMSILMRREKRN